MDLEKLNPFEQKFRGNYSEFVLNQIKDVSIGEAKLVDIGKNKGISSFRMTLRYVQEKERMKFETRLDIKRNLWIKRIE